MKFVQLLNEQRSPAEQKRYKEFLKKEKMSNFDVLKFLQGVNGDQKEFDKEYNLPKNKKMRSAKIKSRTAKQRNNIIKLEKDIELYNKKIKDRSSKSYKQVSGTIDTKDEFGQHAGSINVSKLNELRRKKAIRLWTYEIAKLKEEIYKITQQMIDTIADIDIEYMNNEYIKDIVQKFDLSNLQSNIMKNKHDMKPFEKWARTMG